MKLNMIILEGDIKQEKKLQKEFLHCKSFYLTRILSELLHGLNLDGSGKIAITTLSSPTGQNYIQNNSFNVSLYYLDSLDINSINSATVEQEQSVLLKILRHTLLDIAERNHCDDNTINEIQTAFEKMNETQCILYQEITKLSKKNSAYGFKAKVYRKISKKLGEAWFLEIEDKEKSKVYSSELGSSPSYVNRLNNLYSKSLWKDTSFIILNRLDQKVCEIVLDSRET